MYLHFSTQLHRAATGVCICLEAVGGCVEDMSCLKEEDGETDEERNMEDAHGVLGKNGGRERERER